MFFLYHHLRLTILLVTILTPVHSQCPDILPSLTDKIINGNHSPVTFQLSLASPPTPLVRRCTGTRISKTWALTAAHCNVTTLWTAQHQGTNITNGVPITITQVFTHPLYQHPTDRRYDIAILRLSTDDPVQPHNLLLLNNNPALPLPDAFVRVSGYGANETTTPAPHGILTHVDIPVVDFPTCTRLYRGTANLGILEHEKQICAGYLSGGCDACSGDSGGPIVQFDQQGTAVLMALVSTSRGCALPDFPGIAVRVDAFLPWLRQLGVGFRTGIPLQIRRNGAIVTPSPLPSPSESAVVTPLPTGRDGGDEGEEEEDVPFVAVTPPPKRNRPPGDGRRGSHGDGGRDRRDGSVGPVLPSPVVTPPSSELLDDDDGEDGKEEDGEKDDIVETGEELPNPSDEIEGQVGETLAGDISPAGEIRGGGVNTGIIAGSIVGGLVALAVFVVGAVFFVRARRHGDTLFDYSED